MTKYCEKQHNFNLSKVKDRKSGDDGEEVSTKCVDSTIVLYDGEYAAIQSAGLDGLSYRTEGQETSGIVDIALKKLKNLQKVIMESGLAKLQQIVTEFVIKQVEGMDMPVGQVISIIFNKFFGAEELRMMVNDDSFATMISYLEDNEGRLYLSEDKTDYCYPLLPTDRKVDVQKIKSAKGRVKSLQLNEVVELFSVVPTVRFFYRDERSRLATEIQPLGQSDLKVNSAGINGIWGSVFRIGSALVREVVGQVSMGLNPQRLRASGVEVPKKQIVSTVAILGDTIDIRLPDLVPSTGVKLFSPFELVKVKGTVKELGSGGIGFVDVDIEGYFQRQNLQMLVVPPEKEEEDKYLCCLQMRSINPSDFASGALICTRVALCGCDGGEDEGDVCRRRLQKGGQKTAAAADGKWYAYVTSEDIKPFSGPYVFRNASPKLLECVRTATVEDYIEDLPVAFDQYIDPEKLFHGKDWKALVGKRVTFFVEVMLPANGSSMH